MANEDLPRVGPWLLKQELGRGGQGTVHLAVRVDPPIMHRFAKAVTTLVGATTDSNLQRACIELSVYLRDVGREAAVKVLHELGKDEEAEKARARMEKEVRTMREIRHPHLLHCVEFESPSLRWYATEYHSGGTLDKYKGIYTGRALKALRDLRGVIEGVALLHEHGRVHRDIKPGNIFVASDGRLVLGDFGLVFFKDPRHTRVSGTMENVGSRDWMPGWALSMRVEDVRPTFDVFGLGKVLYSMVSKTPGLRLWYHESPEFNLETMFAGDPGVEWISRILKKSVVEHEKDMGYQDARDLLRDVDWAISELMGRPRWTRDETPKSCLACGLGQYQKIGLLPRAGLPAISQEHEYTMIACVRCGHTQVFRGQSSASVASARTPSAPSNPAASEDRALSAEILGTDWRSDGPQLRIKVEIENKTSQGDTVRRAAVTLNGGNPIDLHSEQGPLPRLEPFDRKEVILRWQPANAESRSYDLVLTLTTVAGRSIRLSGKAAPSNRQGSW